MAFNDIPFGDSASVKISAKQAFLEYGYQSPLFFLQEEEVIYTPEELKNGQAGDLVSVNLFNRIGGAGYTENQVIEGSEQAVPRSVFQATWNELWNAVKVPSKYNIKQQRINTDVSKVGIDRLYDWMNTMQTAILFNQSAGNTGTSITVPGLGATFSGATLPNVLGFNSATAPATSRNLRPNGVATDQALTSSDTFTLSLLDVMIARLRANYPTFATTKSGYIIGFIHPYQARDLKLDAGNQITWYSNALAYATGGDMDELRKGSAFGTRPVTMYQNVILFESDFVPLGVNSGTSAAVSNTYRSVFFGKNAVVYGSPYGGTLDDEDVPYILANEIFDYGRYQGFALGNMSGLKKYVGIDGVSNSVFTITTYAAA